MIDQCPPISKEYAELFLIWWLVTMVILAIPETNQKDEDENGKK